ncbi:MAG: alanine dehydrogenase [Fimbriimonadia bacterium]|jgi:alanine dehydrogenase
MRIGVPRERKADEYRVGMTPAGVEALVKHGHQVVIEDGAGSGTHVENAEYEAAGAKIGSVEEVWSTSEMIVKVKEPLPEEYPRIRPGQVLFTYFHFAASEELTRAMVDSGAICIAYETVELPNGDLPLLIPMSEVAGRLAVQAGAKYLERPFGGRGVLLSGVPGVKPATVTIIGGGVVGINSAKVAAGFGANVYILDVDLPRLRYLDDVMGHNVSTIYSTPQAIRKLLPETDLLIGAVYLTGTRTPVLLSRDMLKLMRPGSLLVDVCVDQGGMAETTRPTTHSNPTYVVDGVVHYCVANMPGAVAETSTYALTNATTPYVIQLADKGYPKALLENPALAKGLNVAGGKVTLASIAEQFGYPYVTPEVALASNASMA